MRIVDSTPAVFRERIKAQRTLCFGCGDYFRLFTFDFGDAAHIVGVIDNDTKKQGASVTAGTLTTTVLSLDEGLRVLNSTNTVLVITASAYPEILRQLAEIPALDHVTCYVYAQIKYSTLKPAGCIPNAGGTFRIPQVIHYSWFGGRSLPENLQRCVDSWRRFCPDCEIVEWNENNYNYRKNPWTAAAFEQKLWARLADYARIDIIASHGGIYFDTDVELLQSLDPLRTFKGFAATEAHGGVNFGSGFGAEAGLEAFQEMIENFHRELENGLTFCNNVGRETEVFWRHGYQLNGQFQIIKDVAVLPFNVLTPIVADTGQSFINSATVGVHRFNRGWRTE